MNHLDKVKESGVQFIWQTGKIYIDEARATVAQAGELPMLHVTDFISDMATAYSAADLVISRAGAGSISEFCLLQKPVILVPSPNVAEDHQTKNALALVNKNAALYVKDSEANDLLLDKAIEAVGQPELLKNLSKNIAELAFSDSANVIAKEVIKLAEKYKEEHGC
jgi:UDP-N-acetylglucosamine--N-acetylmuramyl-(pentapeptide) pyrophosphoryl-undecaprenol N-acetylglucosamine transferase